MQTAACFPVSGQGRFGWCNAASASSSFGRERDSDFGWGLTATVATRFADELSIAAGPSLVLPLWDSYPFIADAQARWGLVGDATGAGYRLQLFWGPMSYDFHDSYSMASGLFVAAEGSFAGAPVTLWVGARIDAVWLAIPVIALYELARGPRD